VASPRIEVYSVPPEGKVKTSREPTGALQRAYTAATLLGDDVTVKYLVLVKFLTSVR
jgi:hypothetical protein